MNNLITATTQNYTTQFAFTMKYSMAREVNIKFIFAENILLKLA